jgi:hypothetical protein
MEREKLGIVSKDKERHLEREKAKAKAAAKDNNKKNKAGMCVAPSLMQPESISCFCSMLCCGLLYP